MNLAQNYLFYKLEHNRMEDCNDDLIFNPNSHIVM